MERPVALIVEDDEHFRAGLVALVEREGFAPREAETLEAARKQLAATPPDVLLVDLVMPDGDGLAFARSEDAVAAGAEVVVITGHGSLESAVEALRGRVTDYLTKPIDHARLRATLAHVLRTRALESEVKGLRSELRALGRFGRMVGVCDSMQRVYDAISRVAPTDATVLIVGESGTGKELAAETIHALSPRHGRALLPLNCGAVSPTLIESELFGHEKGSFTGADRVRKGYFEQADGGTLFLDEVTEMPLELQVKLLRVLETGVVVRVGGTTPIPVDVRVIAATNRDPREAVDSGRLRTDLFYRLDVFPIHLPPLRERGRDVEVLAEHFLRELNCASGTRKAWTPAALERLRANPWRGNVRELRNVVQRAFILAHDAIPADAVPLHAPEARPAAGRSESDGTIPVRVGSSIDDVERVLILATLDQTRGDKRRAAEILGISLKTLYNRLNVYDALQRVS